MKQQKEQILRQALQARDEEIAGYQINIDNYRRAITKMENGGSLLTGWPMFVFKRRLSKLLREHLIEQAKAQLIRDVIAEQLEEMSK